MGGNLISVKTNNGKWMMCVDFRDLNNAYRKDLYPLPIISQLVDTTSSLCLLNFTEIYSGYKQIQMAEVDASYTAFYVVQVMAFGLINADATY